MTRLTSAPSRRQVLIGGAAGAAATVLAARGAAAAPAPRSAPALWRGSAVYAVDTARVHTWASDTWRSLVAMTDEKSGLPADNIMESLAAADRSGYTSPTNIGGYLWSTVVARELDLISAPDANHSIPVQRYAWS